MIGLYLDPATHDLTTDGAGHLRLARDAEAVGQHAKQRLLMWHGEWFLDTEAGVRWLDYVFPKPPSLAIAEAVVKSAVAATPGVTELLSFAMEYDQASRGLRVLTIEIGTQFDETVEVSL